MHQAGRMRKTDFWDDGGDGDGDADADAAHCASYDPFDGNPSFP